MRRMMNLLLCVGAAVAFTGSAFAGTTLINTGNGLGVSVIAGGGTNASSDSPAWENALPNVIATAFNGTYTTAQTGVGSVGNGNITSSFQINGVAGGNLTLTRVQDTAASPVNLILDGSNAGGTGVTDSNWSDGTTSLDIEAKVSADTQNFGYEIGGVNHLLISPATTGLTYTGLHIGPGTFNWYDAISTGDTFYSNDANNTSSSGSAYTSEDHMVTFEVTQNGQALNGASATWLVCFEDTPFCSSDQDYQDLVVEIDATTIPVPAAAWMGLVTLAGVGTVLAFRRRQMA